MYSIEELILNDKSFTTFVEVSRSNGLKINMIVQVTKEYRTKVVKAAINLDNIVTLGTYEEETNTMHWTNSEYSPEDNFFNINVVEYSKN